MPPCLLKIMWRHQTNARHGSLKRRLRGGEGLSGGWEGVVCNKENGLILRLSNIDQDGCMKCRVR